VFSNIQVGARKPQSAFAFSIIVTVEEWLQLEVDLTMPVKSVPAKSTIARNYGMLVPLRMPLLFWTDYVLKWGIPKCSWPCEYKMFPGPGKVVQGTLYS